MEVDFFKMLPPSVSNLEDFAKRSERAQLDRCSTRIQPRYTTYAMTVVGCCCEA